METRLQLALALALAAAVRPAGGQVPPWPPTYSMAASTFLMPAALEGMWNYSAFSLTDWGLVSFDQSSDKAAWVGARPMDVEATMLAQARLARAASPSQKLFLYRNSILMMPYLQSVRALLADAAFAPWFIPFAPRAAGAPPYVNAPCDSNFEPPLCSSLFHSQAGFPGFPHGTPPGPTSDCPAPACDCGGVPCGQYVIDFRRWTDAPVRNSTLRDWYIQRYVLDGSLRADGGGLVDGVFFDDLFVAPAGPTEIGPGFLNDTNLSPEAVADGAAAYAAAMAEVRAAVIAAGGFTWQSFFNNGTNVDNLVRPGNCASALAALCAADSPAQTRALLYGFNGSAHHAQFNSSWILGWQADLAVFLLIRGPFAWLGYGWVGTDAPYFRPPALDVDYGEPVDALCREAPPGSGHFVREWSRATVALDCATWTPSIVLKEVR